MASNNIGTVTVEIVSDGSQFEKDVTKSVNSATAKAEAPAEKGGNKIGAALGKGVGFAAKSAGAVIASAFGASIVKGFGRLNAIDQAEAKLKGLGNTTEEVAGIMDNALSAVVGTAFGLDEAASLAASFMAVNIEAGDELTRALKITADAATIANTSMADMGDIFVDVAAAGKLTGDELNRMSDRGIDALGAVATHFGITREEAQKMVSAGEVSFEEFAAAMEKNLGGAALESGTTFVGAMRNMGAAMGRFGALILKPVFEGIKAIIPSVIAAIDAFSGAFKPIMEEIGPQVAEAFDTIAAALGKIDWAAIGELVVGMARVIWNAIVIVIEVIKEWIASMQPGLTKVLELVKSALEKIPWDAIISAMQRLTPLILGVVAAFLTYQKIVKVINAVKKAMALWRGVTIGLTAAIKGQKIPIVANTIVTKAHTVAMNLMNTATKIATTVTKLFSKALKLLSGPIGWIIALVGILVSALIWFFTQTELGQEIVANVVEFMTNAWQTFVDWIVPLWEGFIQFWIDLWTNVSTFFTDMWTGLTEWFTGLLDGFSAWWTDIWDGITTFFTDIWDGVTEGVKTIWQGWVDWITGVIDGFKEWWNGIWETISEIALAIWDRIKDGIKTRVELIIAIFTGDFAKVKEIISGIWEDVKATTERIWNSIIAWIKEIPDKIKAVFSNAKEWLKGAGRDIMQGLWDGLKQVWEDVKAWFDDKMSALSGMARKITDSHSPSRVFIEIGEDIGAGLRIGLDNSTAGLMKAATNLATTPITASVRSLGQIGTGASTLAPSPAGAQTTFAQGAVQVNGGGDPYKAAILAVNKIAERIGR